MEFNYYTYKSGNFTCPKCNWSGKGSEAFLSDLSEIHTLRDIECPKCNETLHTFDLSEAIEDQEKQKDLE
jgi:transcription initiation factor IIE alpha subunit